jgi:hypothetical protein
MGCHVPIMHHVLWLCLLSEAVPILVTHGRLKEKIKVTVPRDTEGTVEGYEDKMVQVKLEVVVKEKSKEVTAKFEATVLEPLKEDSQYADEELYHICA